MIRTNRRLRVSVMLIMTLVVDISLYNNVFSYREVELVVIIGLQCLWLSLLSVVYYEGQLDLIKDLSSEINHLKELSKELKN